MYKQITNSSKSDPFKVRNNLIERLVEFFGQPKPFQGQNPDAVIKMWEGEFTRYTAESLRDIAEEAKRTLPKYPSFAEVRKIGFEWGKLEAGPAVIDSGDAAEQRRMDLEWERRERAGEFLRGLPSEEEKERAITLAVRVWCERTGKEVGPFSVYLGVRVFGLLAEAGARAEFWKRFEDGEIPAPLPRPSFESGTIGAALASYWEKTVGVM